MGASMRKIIHIDMDCFFAAVEMRDHPQWRNQPLAVGGQASRRGVIATCNYQARAFGVRSAMATAKALQLCPNLLVVPGRMSVYKEVSAQIRAIFANYSQLIEPLSLDEAYLDVTNSQACQGSATLMAEEIRQQIWQQTGLTASAGIAPIKFVAKIASDLNKPNGQFVVLPSQLDDFVAQLPLSKLPGVGRVTAERLRELGLVSCQDLRNFDRLKLSKLFGKQGQILWQRAHAIDDRAIQSNRVRKSIGIETTLNQDIHSPEQVWQQLLILLPGLMQRWQASGERPIQALRLKLKFDDFSLTTVEQRCPQIDESVLKALLPQALERQQGRGIRLVGLQVSLQSQEASSQQLCLPL